MPTRYNTPETQSIQSWYMDAYPSDTLGVEMNSEITFAGLMLALSNGLGYFTYDYLGVGDSIVRERVFARLATIYKVDYEVIYTMWLDKEPANKKYWPE